MNRRDLLRGSAALWGFGSLSPLSGWSEVAQDADLLTVPPKHLLISTFTPELLRTQLVPPGQWHPYPRAIERDAWMQVPEDLRAAMINRAEMWRGL